MRWNNNLKNRYIFSSPIIVSEQLNRKPASISHSGYRLSLERRKMSIKFYVSINCLAECQKESPVSLYLSCTGEPRPSIPDVHHQGWTEGNEHIPWPADNTAPCANRDIIGFLCYKHALLFNDRLEFNGSPSSVSAWVISTCLSPSACQCPGYSSSDEDIEMDVPMHVLMGRLNWLNSFTLPDKNPVYSKMCLYVKK